MATRIVRRRPKEVAAPVLATGPPSEGLCGWCFGAVGAIIPHVKCLGKRSTTFTCRCTVCGYLPPPKES